MKTIISFLVLTLIFTNNSISQSVKISVSEDAFVQGGETANESMGTDNVKVLRVSNSKANNKYARKTYLKFNLPKDLKNIKTIVLNVPVKVFKVDNDPGAKFRLEVFTVKSNDWKEDELTWNNAKEVDSKVGSIEIGQSQENKHEWQQIQLDANIINELITNQTGNIITLALLNNDFNKTSAMLQSKEQSKKTASYLMLE